MHRFLLNCAIITSCFPLIYSFSWLSLSIVTLVCILVFKWMKQHFKHNLFIKLVPTRNNTTGTNFLHTWYWFYTLQLLLYNCTIPIFSAHVCQIFLSWCHCAKHTVNMVRLSQFNFFCTWLRKSRLFLLFKINLFFFSQIIFTHVKSFRYNNTAAIIAAMITFAYTIIWISHISPIFKKKITFGHGSSSLLLQLIVLFWLFCCVIFFPRLLLLLWWKLVAQFDAAAAAASLCI